MYDVTVIGAGPAGSQVAFRLARLGYSVVVVEKKDRLDEPVCCTGIIGQECIRSFEISEKVIHRQANGARIFSPSRKMLSVWRQEPQGEPPFSVTTASATNSRSPSETALTTAARSAQMVRG